MKKRALSGVVSVVLLILLVLAAIMIIWAIIKWQVDKSSELTGIKARLLLTKYSIPPSSVGKTPEENDVSFRVMKEPGSADSSCIVIVLEFTDKTTKSFLDYTDISIDEFDTQEINIDGLDYEGEIDKIFVYACEFATWKELVISDFPVAVFDGNFQSIVECTNPSDCTSDLCISGDCVECTLTGGECTPPDFCSEGNCVECTPTNLDNCASGETCISGECTLTEECSDNSDCDDTNLCTIDSCSSGACSNIPKSCQAGWMCSPSTGECEEETTCSGNEECDDNAYCNGIETCTAGICQPGPAPCNDNIECTIDTCSEATDSCVNDYSQCTGYYVLTINSPAGTLGSGAAIPDENYHFGQNYILKDETMTISITDPSEAFLYWKSEDTNTIISGDTYATITMDSDKTITPVFANQIILVNSCQDLTQPNTYYKLSQNVPFPYTPGRLKCFDILADNIALDGNTYSITIEFGYSDRTVYAIYSENTENIVIKNHRLYTPPTYPYNYIIGIFTSNIRNAVISNNLLEDWGEGMFLIELKESFIVNNNIKRTRQYPVSQESIVLWESSDNIIKGNTIDGSGFTLEGIYLYTALTGSDSNKIIENTIKNINGGRGIYLDSYSTSNIFQDNNLCDSLSYADFLCDNYFENDNIDNGNSYITNEQCGWLGPSLPCP